VWLECVWRSESGPADDESEFISGNVENPGEARGLLRKGRGTLRWHRSEELLHDGVSEREHEDGASARVLWTLSYSSQPLPAHFVRHALVWGGLEAGHRLDVVRIMRDRA
jgi:hypothetical protein